ncbi:MAG: hypothetical protein ACREXX_07025 [Gammaproteobacteria bacterium]
MPPSEGQLANAVLRWCRLPAAAPVAALLPSLYVKYAAPLTALGEPVRRRGDLRCLVGPADGLLVGWHAQRAHRPQAVVSMGGVRITVSLFFLFRIPADAGIVHLTGWAMLFYLGYTKHEVPHMARGTRSIGAATPSSASAWSRCDERTCSRL